MPSCPGAEPAGSITTCERRLQVGVWMSLKRGRFEKYELRMKSPHPGAGGVVAQTGSLLRHNMSSISLGSVRNLPCSSLTPCIGGRRPNIDLPIRKRSAKGIRLRTAGTAGPRGNIASPFLRLLLRPDQHPSPRILGLKPLALPSLCQQPISKNA